MSDEHDTRQRREVDLCDGVVLDDGKVLCFKKGDCNKKTCRDGDAICTVQYQGSIKHQQQPPAPDVIAELHAKVEEFKILSHDCNLDKKDCDYYKRRVVELEDEIAAIRQGSTGGKR